MITNIKGNLLDCPSGVNFIIHQANCANTMGAGIAKQIKERYPQAFQADTNAYLRGTNELGSFSYARGFCDGRKIIIANVYAQSLILSGGEGRATNYEALYNGLESVLRFGADLPMDVKYGIPYGLGSGLAGGDWGIVSMIINVLATKWSANVVIVQFDG